MGCFRSQFLALHHYDVFYIAQMKARWVASLFSGMATTGVVTKVSDTA